jgi:hypothetical protein
MVECLPSKCTTVPSTPKTREELNLKKALSKKYDYSTINF